METGRSNGVDWSSPKRWVYCKNLSLPRSSPTCANAMLSLHMSACSRVMGGVSGVAQSDRLLKGAHEIVTLSQNTCESTVRGPAASAPLKTVESDMMPVSMAAERVKTLKVDP